MKIITEPKDTLTKVSDGLISSNEEWLNFDKYVLEQNPKNTPPSTDTLYYYANSVDTIEFKNSAFQNVIIPNLYENTTQLGEYIKEHNRLPIVRTAVAMMMADKDKIFLKKYPSTRSIIDRQDGKNILVVNKDKTDKKMGVPPFLHDIQIIDEYIQVLAKKINVIPVTVVFEKQFEKDYC